MKRWIAVWMIAAMLLGLCLPHTARAEESGAVQESEAAGQSGAVQGSEAVGQSGAVQGSEAAGQSSGTVQGSEAAGQSSSAVQENEAAGQSGAVQGSEAAGQSGAVQENEAAGQSSSAVELGITAKACVLMEASTGTVLYEKNASERLSPASITKIMTLILIFEALDAGKIKLSDEVTTSAYAKSMGGSQVYLEEGEKQTVETLIKCIVVASGNDASVAMAEYLSGSEAEFVNQMNQKAKELGMNDTHFEDCCGLTESQEHYTSAHDVAVMSRELSVKHPQIHDYSTIWMENITHVTAQGTSEFGLANTNKLLKSYEGCTGLKTGSTSLAKYCLSATAKRGDVELIAVVMAAPDYKTRFSEAETLLNYGFANCTLYRDEQPEALPDAVVKNGTSPVVSCDYSRTFSYLSVSGESFESITKQVHMPSSVRAPVKAGDVLGSVDYTLDGRVIGSVDIVAGEDVAAAGYVDYLKKILNEMSVQ